MSHLIKSNKLLYSRIYQKVVVNSFLIRNDNSSKILLCHSKNEFNFIAKRNLTDGSFTNYSTSLNKSFINSDLIVYLQNLLISIHDYTGLSWYQEIILISIFLRILTIPVSIYEKKLLSKYERFLLPEFNLKREKIIEEAKLKLQLREFRNEKIARKYINLNLKKTKNELQMKYNCHPMKRVISVLSTIPGWIIASYTVGNLCSRNVDFVENREVIDALIKILPQISTEGCLWFSNLTKSDPYHILPIILFTSLYTSLEFNNLIRKYNYTESTAFVKSLNVAFKIFAVLLTVVSNIVPSGLTLYWTSNSILSTIQNLTLNNEKVRKFLKISNNMYQPNTKDLYDHLKNKIKNKKFF